MASEPVRIALIGAGRMGRIHLGALQRADGIELAGVVEPVAATRRQLTAGGVRTTYATVDDLLERVDQVLDGRPAMGGAGRHEDGDADARIRPGGHVERQLDGMRRRVRSRPRDHRHAAIRDGDRDAHQPAVLRRAQRGCLSGGAADDDSVGAMLEQVMHQPDRGFLIEAAASVERGDHRGQD